MTPEVESTCGLCGARSFTELLDEARLWKVPAGRRMLRCQRCSLVQIAPRDTATTDYDGDYFDSCQDFAEGTLRHSARVSVFRQRLGEISRRGDPGRLLDVGSAMGDFLRLARDQFHWKVVGLDISEWAAERARALHGLDVQVAVVSEATFCPGEFDVVHANHVLEHMPAPLAALRKFWVWLKPGGYLFIEVPNEMDNLPWHLDVLLGRTRINGSLARQRTPRSQPTPHLYFFTRETLSHILLEAGFEIADLRTRTDTASCGVWPSESFPDEAKLKIAAYRLTRRIGQWIGKGTNVMAIARKPPSGRTS